MERSAEAAAQVRRSPPLARTEVLREAREGLAAISERNWGSSPCRDGVRPARRMAAQQAPIGWWPSRPMGKVWVIRTPCRGFSPVRAPLGLGCPRQHQQGGDRKERDRSAAIGCAHNRGNLPSARKGVWAVPSDRSDSPSARRTARSRMRRGVVAAATASGPVARIPGRRGLDLAGRCKSGRQPPVSKVATNADLIWPWAFCSRWRMPVAALPDPRAPRS